MEPDQSSIFFKIYEEFSFHCSCPAFLEKEEQTKAEHHCKRCSSFISNIFYGYLPYIYMAR